MNDSLKLHADHISDQLELLKRELALATEADKCIALRDAIDLLKTQLTNAYGAFRN